MARRKKKCQGTLFRMKMKDGKTRCVCGFTNDDDQFRVFFQANDQCPRSGKAITFKQARTKYGK